MSWSRTFALLALLVSATAGAQISLVPLQILGPGNLSTYTFGANACTGNITATWQSTLTGQPASDLTFWVSQYECGDTSVAGDLTLDSQTVSRTIVFSVRTGTITVDTTALPFPGNQTLAGYDGGVTCGAANAEVTMRLCGSISLLSGISTIVNHASPLEIDYDTQAPAAPAIETVVAKDAALTVTVSATSDSQFVYLEAKGPADTDFSHSTQIVIANTQSATINDLTNGDTYDVRAYAVDAAGNQSGYSDPVAGTPLHTTGFWEAYRRAGGQAQGCSAAWGAPLLFGALLVLFRRRKA